MASPAPNSSPMVLIVDDEPGICELLAEILHEEGYRTVTAPDGAQAQKAMVDQAPDVVLLDIWMPDIDGISLIRQWKEEGLTGPAIIVMSGHATVDTAVEATRLGAVDFVEKPISNDKLLSMVRKATTASNKPLFNPLLQEMNMGKSDAMAAFKDELLKATALSSGVLLVGPPDCGAPFFAGLMTPPGKGMEILHAGNQLDADPMILLKKARGGLVFVGNLDLLEGPELRGLYLLASKAGQTKTRIVAHSALPPKELRAIAEFDDKLLDHFHAEPIQVPAFTEFVSDIPELAVLISKQLVAREEVPPHRLSSGAINALVNHRWDGNFSQLVKIVRNAMLFATAEDVDESVMTAVLSQNQPTQGSVGFSNDVFDRPLREAREVFEREYFKRLLARTSGNIVLAAQKAGLERTYLYRKLKHLELEEIEIH